MTSQVVMILVVLREEVFKSTKSSYEMLGYKFFLKVFIGKGNCTVITPSVVIWDILGMHKESLPLSGHLAFLGSLSELSTFT